MSDNKTKGVTIKVKVQPAARNTQVTVTPEGIWRVKVTAPPVKGKANKQCLQALAAFLQLDKARLSIVRGATSPWKEIFVEGLETADLQRALPGGES